MHAPTVLNDINRKPPPSFHLLSSWSFPVYFAGKNMQQSKLRHPQNVPRWSPQQAPSNLPVTQHFLFGSLLPYDGPLPPPAPFHPGCPHLRNMWYHIWRRGTMYTGSFHGHQFHVWRHFRSFPGSHEHGCLKETEFAEHWWQRVHYQPSGKWTITNPCSACSWPTLF